MVVPEDVAHTRLQVEVLSAEEDELELELSGEFVITELRRRRERD